MWKTEQRTMPAHITKKKRRIYVQTYIYRHTYIFITTKQQPLNTICINTDNFSYCTILLIRFALDAVALYGGVRKSYPRNRRCGVGSSFHGLNLTRARHSWLCCLYSCVCGLSINGTRLSRDPVANRCNATTTALA